MFTGDGTELLLNSKRMNNLAVIFLEDFNIDRNKNNIFIENIPQMLISHKFWKIHNQNPINFDYLLFLYNKI